MKLTTLISIVTMFVLSLSGCATGPAPDLPKHKLPQDIQDTDDHITGLNDIRLDYVDIGTPTKYQTPIMTGITVNNTCAKIISADIDGGYNSMVLRFKVMEDFHFGYKCYRSPSRLNWKGNYPFKVDFNDTLAVRVIVNDKDIGTIEKYPQRIPTGRPGRPYVGPKNQIR